ncbi:hypothetical protein [Plantactinospora sp. GCM10030261]|uniref:hypothetical protein n=1 Tax=Plantactinospora sp. GCM10030261 TaxID=3273420 RepID=UPI00361FC731
MALRYLGNGPYCTANSLSIIFGDDGPGPATIEVLTGSPYGISIHGDDEYTYFTPDRWNPEFGITSALDLLGWECDRTAGSADAAVAVLRGASREAPVLVGPVEMGLLPYIPGLGRAIGADHNVVVVGMEGDLVRAHDVQGWPFVTMPLESLLKAWQADTFAYRVDAYAVRSNFRRTRMVDPHTAVRRSLPTAIELLDGPESAAAAERSARIVEAGLTNMQYKYLVEYQVQAGARRFADATAQLDAIGCRRAAAVADRQALLIGSLQLLLVTHEAARAAATFRELAPTYGQLRQALVDDLGQRIPDSGVAAARIR